MARRPNSTKLLIRNICMSALQDNTSFALHQQRIEVSVVDDLTLQVKVFGDGNPNARLPDVKVTGSI